MDKFETIPYLGIKSVSIVYETKELIGICPKTGRPDIYKLKITYTPRTVIPELYSFKKYLYKYMDIRIFQEHLASEIYLDFEEIVNPSEFNLELSESNPYGLYPTVYL